MNIQNSPYLSIEQVQNQYLSQTKKTQPVTKSGETFQDILNQKTSTATDSKETLKFSKHAAGRLETRNITLTDSQLTRLNQGTQKASEKGINESLVIVDQLAFIVNIPNKTVITAMDQTETNENIFTNIDGAVIM